MVNVQQKIYSEKYIIALCNIIVLFIILLYFIIVVYIYNGVIYNSVMQYYVVDYDQCLYYSLQIKNRLNRRINHNKISIKSLLEFFVCPKSQRGAFFFFPKPPFSCMEFFPDQKSGRRISTEELKTLTQSQIHHYNIHPKNKKRNNRKS